MKMTIRSLRKSLDAGLLSINEIVGMRVSVGFVNDLEITGYELTPGDYMPNVWHLERNNVQYEFVPHWGLQRV